MVCRLVPLLRSLVSRRHLVVRRCVAVATAVSAGLFAAESLVADTCDGGTHAVVEASGTLHGDLGHASTDGHPVHACHCVHAHVSDLPPVMPLMTRPPAPGVIVGRSEVAPPSITLDPPPRPPAT